MKKILIINGSAESGKDSFIEECQKIANFPIFNFSAIDTVKAVMASDFGWDGEKSEEARLFMVQIKQGWMAFNDGPFEEAKRIIAGVHHGLIFYHIREPDQIAKMKLHYGDDCIALLVKMPGIYVPDNIADKSVEDYSYDRVVINDGSLVDLEEKALQFINEISEEI